MKKSFAILLSLIFSIELFGVQQYNIQFKPLEESELVLIHTWLHQPWVKRWYVHEALPWQEFLQFRDEIKNYFGSGNEFLVMSNGYPFAYIRYYDAHLWPDGYGNVEPEGMYGIDLYIGDSEYLGKGYGTALLHQFIKKIIQDQKELGLPVKQLVIAPEVANNAAIKTYLKVGFFIDHEIDDPYWGKQYSMTLDPELIELEQDIRNFFVTESSYALCPERFHEYMYVLMSNTWEHLKEHVSITFGDCQEFLREYDHLIKAEMEKHGQENKVGALSAQTMALIHDILADFEIDPQSIAIIPCNGNGSPAAADDYMMYIDEKELASLCAEMQRFVIAHEASHIAFKDHAFISALQSLMVENTKAQSNALHVFFHVTELCADMNAMLKSLEYTKGGIEFFKMLMDSYGDTYSPMHPRPSQRLKIAQEIEAMHMQQEQWSI